MDFSRRPISSSITREGTGFVRLLGANAASRAARKAQTQTLANDKVGTRTNIWVFCFEKESTLLFFVPTSLHVVGRNRMAQYFRMVSKKTRQKKICLETCASLPFNYYSHFQQWQPLRRRFSPLGVVSAPRGQLRSGPPPACATPRDCGVPKLARGHPPAMGTLGIPTSCSP